MIKATYLVPISIIIGFIIASFSIYYSVNPAIEKLGPIVNDTQSINETKPPVINETTVVCGNGTQLVNNTCVAIPETEPKPLPKPVSKPFNMIAVGDIYGPKGKEVASSIIAKNPDLVTLLGDLCYTNNIKCLTDFYGPIVSKLICVIGNHEAPIIKLALDFCGNDYHIKQFNNVLLFGINTESTLTTETKLVTGLVSNSTFMKNIKTVFVFTHKGCQTPPNSHHPSSEDKDVPPFCNAVIQAMPKNVTLIFVSGHNHVMSEGKINGITYIQSGGGGRSNSGYNCGTNTQFYFCVQDYGFVKFTLQPTGDVTWQFFNSKGVLIK